VPQGSIIRNSAPVEEEEEKEGEGQGRQGKLLLGTWWW
jgi:hypothetical protein